MQSPSWSTDFCVKPKLIGEGDEGDVTARASSSTGPTDPFKLKMYWEPGYSWQGEYFERKCKSPLHLECAAFCETYTMFHFIISPDTHPCMTNFQGVSLDTSMIGARVGTVFFEQPAIQTASTSQNAEKRVVRTGSSSLLAMKP